MAQHPSAAFFFGSCTDRRDGDRGQLSGHRRRLLLLKAAIRHQFVHRVAGRGRFAGWSCRAAVLLSARSI